jgi:hypothetical protein
MEKICPWVKLKKSMDLSLGKQFHGVALGPFWAKALNNKF